jgi:hypothetical protein
MAHGDWKALGLALRKAVADNTLRTVKGRYLLPVSPTTDPACEHSDDGDNGAEDSGVDSASTSGDCPDDDVDTMLQAAVTAVRKVGPRWAAGDVVWGWRWEGCARGVSVCGWWLRGPPRTWRPLVCPQSWSGSFVRSLTPPPGGTPSPVCRSHLP